MMLISFIVSITLSAILTFFWIKIVKKWGILDIPRGTQEPRKLHKTPVPLLGSVAILGAFTIMLAAVYFLNSAYQTKAGGTMGGINVVYFAVALFVIMIGGYIDDKYNIKAWQQIIFPTIATGIIIYGGLNIGKITNPFGGLIMIPTAISGVLAFLWLLGMSYTTKILDGLDGLATGITAIGALMIAALSLFTKWYQPDVALVAIIFAGACLGFLIFNFHPAKIFLGEGGSIMLGFVLGVLAIISGSKIMTTLLVVGLPVLDVAWAVVRRAMKHKAISIGDRSHAHHLLVDGGFSHAGAVLFLYSVAFTFGIAGIFLSSAYKLMVLVILGVFSLVLLGFFGAFKQFD